MTSLSLFSRALKCISLMLIGCKYWLEVFRAVRILIKICFLQQCGLDKIKLLDNFSKEMLLTIFVNLWCNCFWFLVQMQTLIYFLVFTTLANLWKKNLEEFSIAFLHSFKFIITLMSFTTKNQIHEIFLCIDECLLSVEK